jgi:hypothetical protein
LSAIIPGSLPANAVEEDDMSNRMIESFEIMLQNHRNHLENLKTLRENHIGIDSDTGRDINDMISMEEKAVSNLERVIQRLGWS